MEPDDLLCSRNARPQKALVGRAQWKINQPPSLKRKQVSLEGSFLTSFDARNIGSTRPHYLWTITSKLGRMGKEWPGALLARRTRTMKLCSSDARSKGQPWPLP
jgi:hypothetical protein